MTWQRIDDDTYIDDTLVTCAEYQLFIDEMREEGKYYQPDHWHSYLFPKGHAKEPILGVRYSDAVAFCEWLLPREEEEWKYRLPTQKEVLCYAIKSPAQAPIGYWIIATDNQSRFAWIGIIIDNPRGNAIESARVYAFDSARAHDRELALARAGAEPGSYFYEVDHSHDHDLTLARNRELTLSFDRARHRPIELDHAVMLHRDFVHYIDRSRISALSGNLDRAQEDALERAISIINRYIPDRALAIDMFIDIFTVQERIAGRSPAFEGIRLVKERIK